MNKVKAIYISDIHSIFFKKGEIYDAYTLDNYPKTDLLAFHFTEDEMDIEGMYALPANRFRIVAESKI